MDGRGRWLDNVFVERLWRSLKYEEVHLKAYANRLEVRIGIGQWFRFYNDSRPHQALGYKTRRHRGRPKSAPWICRCAWTTLARRPQLHRANNSRTWFESDQEKERPSPYQRTPAVLSLGSTAPVRRDLVETVKTSSEPEMAHRRASEWLRTLGSSMRSVYTPGRGGAEPWKRHPSNESSPRSSPPMLLATASAVDALQCAVAVQKAIAKENADRPADEHMRFRIGIHVGDIMVQGDNLFGDAVNIAARLEALAEPGGICISGAVRDHIGTKLPVEFIDLGLQQVKNISATIKVYRIGGQSSPTATLILAASHPLPDKPSIAVLPFTNMSAHPEQEFFGDGIAEDV
jgi:hypothetical protein